jgi:hypothetical protein
MINAISIVRFKCLRTESTLVRRLTVTCKLLKRTTASQREINAFKEYAVNLTSELKADFADMKANIAKVNEKLDGLKIQLCVVQIIIIMFLSAATTIVVPYFGKKWGWFDDCLLPLMEESRKQ